MKEKILRVSEITADIKAVLEDNFQEVSVIGELSNYKAHYSGHWYFSLKDADAQISCNMWRSFTQYVFFSPQDGMKVIVKGRLSVYAPRGTYSIDVRSMQPAGEGELQMAFDQLKKKLYAEGLFDEERKRPIPRVPGTVGIATAIDGAALQDMITAAQRRYPLLKIVVAPCKVQGAGASQTIADAIGQLNKYNDVDVIIVARGGGSIEDLWAFNEEQTARAIFDSAVPVVTGIGHEVDFTIADYVADRRAPTPTAAMELVTPEKEQMEIMLASLPGEYAQRVTSLLRQKRKEIDAIVNGNLTKKPFQIVNYKFQELDYSVYRLQEKMQNLMRNTRHKLEVLQIKLASHNVENQLKKGFVLVKQRGKFVKRAIDLNHSDAFDLKFFDNTITVTNEKK